MCVCLRSGFCGPPCKMRCSRDGVAQRGLPLPAEGGWWETARSVGFRGSVGVPVVAMTADEKTEARRLVAGASAMRKG